MNGFKNIAYEQAHRGALAAGREKEDLHLWDRRQVVCLREILVLLRIK